MPCRVDLGENLPLCGAFSRAFVPGHRAGHHPERRFERQTAFRTEVFAR